MSLHELAPAAARAALRPPRRAGPAPCAAPQPRIVGLGAGGHAKCVIEALRTVPRYRMAGLLDADRRLHGRRVEGVPVVGDEDRLEALVADGVGHAFVGVGGAEDLGPRAAALRRLRAAGLALPPVVHRRAVVARSARLGDGAQVLAVAIVNPGAEVGAGAIVNAGAIVGHDARVGPGAHVASGVRLGGAAQVGEQALVGAGAVVLPGVRVGDGARVGAGAVVVDHVPDGVVVVGAPARPARGGRP